MNRNQKIRLISSMVSLTLCFALLIISMYAWYCVNKVALVTGGTASTSNANQVQFTTITSKRYSLSGDYQKNTYKVQKNKIIITRMDSYTTSAIKNATEYASAGTLYTRDDDYVFTEVSSTAEYDENKVYYKYSYKTEFTSSDNTSFACLNMLPGEYVDITVGFTMDDALDGSHYTMQLRDMTGGAFVVDEKTHYAFGAYCYKRLGLEPKTGTVEYTPDSDYTFFKHYDIAQNDETSITTNILEGEWDSDYEELFFTFRVMEDFTEFYALLGKAEKTYGNLLNRLTFNIGTLFIVLG